MVDKVVFLELLNEFSELIARPENQMYREGERRLDYLALMLHAVIGISVEDIPKGDPYRIVWVYSELSEMLKDEVLDELMELKHYVCGNSDYAVRITPSNPVTTFVVHAIHYDLNIIIEPL